MRKSTNPDIDKKIMLCASEWKVPFDSDISAVKASVMERIKLGDDAEHIPEKSGSRFTFWKVAAAIGFLIIVGGALFLSENRTVKNDTMKSVLCALPDGSEIMLSPGSEVRYNALKWTLKRSVDFSGEGYFTIQKGKPFRVYTQQGEIKVLGTKFTVWSDNDDLFVHCSSGHVKVTHGTDEADLLSSEFTLLEKGKLTKKMVYPTEGFITPRITNRLTFNAVPVGIVISELEKVFHTEFDNELPANLIYSGILDIRDENQCLEVFCKPFGAKFDKNANGDVSIHL